MEKKILPKLIGAQPKDHRGWIIRNIDFFSQAFIAKCVWILLDGQGL